ncbi:MAG: SGNH family hydrolase [Sideroxyarcus sp.]|nr:SGNH family hydrolase [Sideroxyarcus sp.]
MDYRAMESAADTESQHTKALLGITFASLLLVVVKGSALLQYWQQTHHILLEFGSLPSVSSYLPDTGLIKEWKRQWDNTQRYWSGVIDQSESRMLLAGQLLLLGDEALPKPELPVVVAPVCPKQELITQACPEPIAQENPVAYETPTAAMAETPLVIAGVQTSVAVDPTDLATNPETATDNYDEPESVEATTEAIAAAQGPIPLGVDDRILLVGDSLMQGLAPHLITNLKRKYKVESMDLSKHSTGLTYPAFFDWPATLEDAFELEDYSVVIVFLGANDPWDMTIHGRYIRFGSEPWAAVYRERVARIINTAASHRARLVWLGVPPMGREDLIGKAQTLNAIYAEEADKMPLFARFVATDPTLTADGSSFTKFLELPDRGSVMVRTDDGVHFTTQGHRLLANLTLTQFGVASDIADPATKSAAEPANATDGTDTDNTETNSTATNNKITQR